MSSVHEIFSKKLASLSDPQRRNLRIKIYNETKDHVNRGFYDLPNGQRIELITDFHLQATARNLQVESCNQLNLPEFEPRNTLVDVVNGDCLECAIKIKNLEYNPVVLNMASHISPGGGVALGAGAQEENLFRRTNYFQHIKTNPIITYPIKPEGGIYSPDVVIFRSSESSEYQLLENPISMSFIAVPAIRRPSLRDDDYNYHDRNQMINKIRCIFSLAACYGHDSVILSAFGCGAYQNPPNLVARYFNEVLNLPEFSNRFSRVIFAIFDDHNSRQSHNPHGNVTPFAQQFNTREIYVDDLI